MGAIEISGEALSCHCEHHGIIPLAKVVLLNRHEGEYKGSHQIVLCVARGFQRKAQVALRF